MQEGKTAVVVQELLTSSGKDTALAQDMNDKHRWPDLPINQMLSFLSSAAAPLPILKTEVMLTCSVQHANYGN